MPVVDHRLRGAKDHIGGDVLAVDVPAVPAHRGCERKRLPDRQLDARLHGSVSIRNGHAQVVGSLDGRGRPHGGLRRRGRSRRAVLPPRSGAVVPRLPLSHGSARLPDGCRRARRRAGAEGRRRGRNAGYRLSLIRSRPPYHRSVLEASALDAVRFHQLDLLRPGNDDRRIGNEVQVLVALLVVDSVEDHPHRVRAAQGACCATG